MTKVAVGMPTAEGISTGTAFNLFPYPVVSDVN